MYILLKTLLVGQGGKSRGRDHHAGPLHQYHLTSCRPAQIFFGHKAQTPQRTLGQKVIDLQFSAPYGHILWPEIRNWPF